MQALAILLYESGDLNHAYKYIKYSLEDAIFCNARLHTFQISKIYPIINETYLEKEYKQKAQLRFYLLLTTVLSFSLIIAIVYVYRQMKKLNKARKELSNINLQLKELNGQLQDYNQKLSEANHIKEEYIGHFLDTCSTYIDKLDNYRKTLNRKASDHKMEELFRMLKSSEMVEKELAELYQNFDNIFLFLFPTFVDDFNALLLPKERFERKQGELLNAEMRIFALIRLGITDSSKIAKFLRYSNNTIYNYRAKIKNKSAIPREDFEKAILKIGSFSK
jgi:Mg2+ and Co2+ transporter CorA